MSHCSTHTVDLILSFFALFASLYADLCLEVFIFTQDTVKRYDLSYIYSNFFFFYLSPHCHFLWFEEHSAVPH